MKLHKPHVFGFFLVPDFALLPFASATDPLRVANWLSGEELFTWKFISENGEAVSSSTGITITPHFSIGTASDLDDVVVVAGGRVGPVYNNKKVLSWLRRVSRFNCRVGAIGLGTFILARAGLLEGRRCTVHWQHLDGFKAEFPDIEVTNEVYEIDRGRFTCSGGTGVLDVMLALIAEKHGHALAVRVAEEFIHERIRTDQDVQRMPLRTRLNTSHPKLLEAVKEMEGNIEDPLSCHSVAESVGLSIRHLEKLFRTYLKVSPREYYIKLRLNHARSLLHQTSMSVHEIGLAAGFKSASHFSKAYCSQFRKSPRSDRTASAGQMT